MKFLFYLRCVGLVVLLVGCLSFMAIGVLDISLSPLDSGSTLFYAQGRLIAVAPDGDFVLLTTQGTQLHFRCASGCRASLSHLQRHLQEHASTDVYYEAGNQYVLLARYVD